jgi:hypothetical protein
MSAADVVAIAARIVLAPEELRAWRVAELERMAVWLATLGVTVH